MFVILRYQVCGYLSQQPLETNTCSGYVARKDGEGIKKKITAKVIIKCLTPNF